MGWCCRVGPWPKGGTNPPQLTIRVNFEEGRLADRVAFIRYGVGIKLEGACVSPTSIEAHARWAAGTACNEASMAVTVVCGPLAFLRDVSCPPIL